MKTMLLAAATVLNLSASVAYAGDSEGGQDPVARRSRSI